MKKNKKNPIYNRMKKLEEDLEKIQKFLINKANKRKINPYDLNEVAKKMKEL